jgi:hypothetical protein
MSALIEEIQEDLSADIAFELSRLQENQLVRLKWSGREYIYGHREGVGVWSVPADEQTQFENLLNVLREFEQKIEEIGIDEELAKRFTSRYFRTRSDLLTKARCLSVGIAAGLWYSPDERASLARIERANKKLQNWPEDAEVVKTSES